MASTLKLYTFGTPNGYKVSVFLELLGLKYDVHSIDISTLAQKEEWFTKLNPNGRIPTLVDDSTGTVISETGAILQYLADTYDKDHKFSYKVGTPLYYKQLELSYFQMAGLGPMQGQANHFTRYAKEKIPYGIDRYVNETKRLYSVLDEVLKRNASNGPYLVGDHISIADILSFPWAYALRLLDIDPHQWPYVAKWYDHLSAIPEVKEGLNKPPPRI